MVLSLDLTFALLLTRYVNICMPLLRSTWLRLSVYFSFLKPQSLMGFIFVLTHYISKPFVMWAGLDLPLIVGPLVVFVCFWDLTLFPGVLRSKTLWLIRQLIQNIDAWPTPLPNSLGCALSSVIFTSLCPLFISSGVTMLVLYPLNSTQFFMTE